MPSPIDNALAATKTPATAPRASRSALAIGTVGRIGEELLNCLLESPEYHVVHVLVETPMRSMMPRLQPHQVSIAAMNDLPHTSAKIALPRADDVFCCISDARSYFKRDRAYVMLGKDQIPPLAQIAAGNGAKRFILLAPLSVFLQLTAPAGG